MGGAQAPPICSSPRFNLIRPETVCWLVARAKPDFRVSKLLRKVLPRERTAERLSGQLRPKPIHRTPTGQLPRAHSNLALLRPGRGNWALPGSQDRSRARRDGMSCLCRSAMTFFAGCSLPPRPLHALLTFRPHKVVLPSGRMALAERAKLSRGLPPTPRLPGAGSTCGSQMPSLANNSAQFDDHREMLAPYRERKMRTEFPHYRSIESAPSPSSSTHAGLFCGLRDAAHATQPAYLFEATNAVFR